MNNELEAFRRDPLAWSQEWVSKNGKIVIGDVEVIKLDQTHEKRYYVALHVDDGRDHPLSTGVHNSVAQAFENAIKGLAQFMG